MFTNFSEFKKETKNALVKVDLIETFLSELDDCLVEAEVDYPAGRDAGPCIRTEGWCSDLIANALVRFGEKWRATV